MADQTHIEWADASWTPIRARYIEIQNDGSGKERIGWYCTHVSEGCRHCYAERLNLRLGTGRDYAPDELYRPERKGYYNGEVKPFLDEKMLTQPLRWKKSRKIFVCSMTDLFAEFHSDEWIDRVFAVMALCPQHVFQVLTKRAKRMREYLTNHADGGRHIWQAGQAIEMPRNQQKSQPGWPLPNIWLGVSVEDQTRADERIPELLATPAAKRFISAEPLLSGIDLRAYLTTPDSDWKITPDRALDWVIVGGESGPHARPMHPAWARSLRDQCAADGVAFFFKQWGNWMPSPDFEASKLAHGRGWGQHDHHLFVDGALMDRVGKKAAGALLDGKEHREFPV